MSTHTAGQRPLRVAWLCPYPVDRFADELQVVGKSFHPSTWIVNLSTALADLGEIELHVITLDRAMGADGTIEAGGVTFHCLRRGKQTVSLLTGFQFDRRRLHRLLRQIDPDLIHSHGTEDVYSYAGVTSGIPCLVSLQGIATEIFTITPSHFDLGTLYFGLVQFLERYTIRRGRFFISKTPFAELFIRKNSPSAVVYPIENPVSPCFFEVERREETSLTILFVGYLTEQKGLGDLIEAFRILASYHPDVSLELIGKDDSAYVNDVIRPMIRRSDLEERVRFLGFLPSTQIAKSLGRATMLVLPSHMDTSPNVISEAMAAGVPVVGTSIGGIPFMLDGGRVGVLVEPRDPSALAEAISGLFDDPERAQRLGRLAREAARARFHPPSIAQKVAGAYREILRQSVR